MAIDTSIPQDVVHTLVKPKKSFFPSRIPVLHNQLRHIISSPASNWVYFANLKDVYRLDLSTNKRTHIQELPFEPRCTVTGHGFFCAGDEHGYFAFIQIPESGTTPPTSSAVDGPLSGLFGRAPTLAVRVEQLGNDIMNSISIHKLHKPAPGVDSDVVAVLTNNDKSLRIYSLTRELSVTVDSFDFPMNHATISPDGQRMVVVGDEELVYFYKKHPVPSGKSSDPSNLLGYKFELDLTLPLHKPSRALHSAYFTTAWSPSGRLCATASEDGYITVFDVDALDDAEGGGDAVIAIVPSSRPNTTAGAIRSMTFAPEPWDLLIWAENFGRVCVGDLRHGLVTRQVVSLDSKADGVERVQLTDSSSIYEDSRDSDPETDLALALERRRLQDSENGNELDAFSAGLNEHEREILENLRTTRQREEAFHEEALDILRRHGPDARPPPRSITYYPSTRNADATFREASRTDPDRLAFYRHDFSHRNGASPSRRGDSSTTSPATDGNRASSTNGNDPWHTIEQALDNNADMSNALTRVSANTGASTYASIASRHLGRDDGRLRAYPGLSALGADADPSLSHTNLPSTAGAGSSTTSITLPALRDLAGPRAPTASADDPQRRVSAVAREYNRQVARTRERERARDFPPRGGAAAAAAGAGSASMRDAASAALGRYENSLLRRVGVRIGSSEAASLRRVYGLPNTHEEEREMGVGTTGLAVGDGGRSLYVGTEEGVWLLGLDFASRKGCEAVEWC